MKKTYTLLLSLLLLLLVDDINAQLKLGDQPTSVQKSVVLDLQGSNGRQGVWLPRISDTTDATGIDGLNPPDGVLIYHTPSSQVMIRKSGYWNSLQTTTKVGSTTSSNTIIEFQLGTAAGATKDLNYSLNSSTAVITLNVPDASVDTRGVVTIGSQTFGGIKTFSDGLTSLSTTTIGGASSNASNLYLGITSATAAGTTTDKYLSVDNSGRVVLSQGLPSSRTMTINGTSYDLSANRTWNVGTVTSVAGGYGLNGGTITNSGTLSIDTGLIASRAWRQKGIDSVVALLNGYIPATRTLNGLALSNNQTFATGTAGTDFNINSSGTTHTFNIPTASSTNRGLLSSADWTTFNNKVSTSRTITINGTTQDLSANRTWNVGTVTSVGAGYGITGGTITTTGTHGIDTGLIATRAWRQKGIDSVAALINGYVPSTRSINGLSLAFNHTFSIGASGTDFNIVSGGSTHTFNMPTASATNRGLLSTSDWTTFNNKVPSTRTLNGLALSNDQTFTTGTSGTDFNISSTGTTHTFNIPNASATARGAVSTAAQTFAGVKTFSTGATVSGATSNASNLTLGITSATTPGTATDRYLTVDNIGRVVLSSFNGMTSLSTIGSSPNANGASITNGVFSLQPASANFGGVVTTGTQTIAGEKTFSTGVTVSGATSNASNLTLGITSATTPGSTTDNFLTVDGSGTVTLNPVPVTAPNGAVKIKRFTDQLDGMPNNLSANSSGIYTFTIAGANLSTSSVVYISPTQDLQTTTSINWVRVVNATTIRVSFSAGSNQQNFTPGNSSTFNITVIEW